MSNTTKIATLEALLERVKRNAALPRVNGAAPAAVLLADTSGSDVDDLLDAPVADAMPEVEAFDDDGPRPRMETFAGEEIFDDDEIVELDEDDGIEILEDISEEEDEFEVAVSPEPPAVEVAASPEPHAVEIAAASVSDEAAFAGAPVDETMIDAPVVEAEPELEVVEPEADEAPPEAEGFELGSPARPSSEVSSQKPPIDAFDDLDFDDEPEADVSSVQPAVRREDERSSVHAAANREDDLDFDLSEPVAEAEPISSPRAKPSESMDEALQSAADRLAPLTPPPESGQQPASQRDGAVSQSALEEALVRESTIAHEIPEATDVDDLLEADVVPAPRVQQARPEMPTLEQLGQTVELEPSLGDGDLELDPTASKEVQESQGPRVRFTPPPPTEELEMALPSRPSGAYDINLKPPPEVGEELAELRRREAEREERHSAPVHEAVSPPGEVEVSEQAEPAEPLPDAMRAAVSASSSPEVLARKEVVVSDSIVERKDTMPSPRSATFVDWLNASLSLD
ncbi:MAG: hypothetical protein R3B89_14175 [Polyangiaceae bacterium]